MNALPLRFFLQECSSFLDVRFTYYFLLLVIQEGVLKDSKESFGKAENAMEPHQKEGHTVDIQ